MKIFSKNNIKLIFFNLIIFLGLLIFLELSLYSIRRFVFKKPSIGLLLKTNDFRYDGCQDMISHPFYGYVHNFNSKCKIRGGFKKGPFVYYNSYNPNNNSIVVFGGSTTDGYFNHISDGFTWPFYLQKIIDEKKLNYNVINAGVGGYNSNQELLKLIIEAKNIDTKITHILSFNGVNDIDNYKGLSKILKNKMHFYDNSLINMYDKKVYVDQTISSFKFLPNIFYTLRFISNSKINLTSDFFSSSFDEDYKEITNSDNWLFNVKIMNNISNLMNAKYTLFLQPTMGIKGQVPTNKNTSDYKIYHEQMTEDYFIEINSHYDILKKLCKDLSFCVDISILAPPKNNFYNDIRHHNKFGNKLIAEEIFKNIFEEL